MPTRSFMRRGASVSIQIHATLCRSRPLPSSTAIRLHRRPLHLGTIRKRELAQEEWDARAERIAKGEEPNLWESFKERGFVKDLAGTDKQIDELMRRKRIGVYVGIDPTAASLHLGHLLPLMPLFWMYMHGYRAVSLLGGATCKVGDPTGRLTSRDSVSKAERAMYITKMHYQLKRIWLNVDAQARRHGYEKQWAWNRELANNSHWYNTTPFTEVVHRLFAGMRLGPMLSRDTVKRKMEQGDGMSLAEFIYPLMQAWDWWKMFSGPRGVCMQIGGSDQYGNIVAGIDAIKLLRENETDPSMKIPNDPLHTPVGFTVPLLTDSSGNKFGKTAGNAMWLDPFMTSSFDLYGYFMRRPDDELERLLKLFTFLPLDKIREIMAQHNLDPPKRYANHILAFEVLVTVHGLHEALATQQKHRLLFSKGAGEAELAEPITGPSGEELAFYPAGPRPSSADLAVRFRPDIQLPESLILGESIVRILHAAGLAASASDAHRLVSHQGAYVGAAPGRKWPHLDVEMPETELTYTPVKGWFPSDTKNFLIDGKLLILRRGKHFVRIVEMISDEQWQASGRSYPGESGKGRLRLLREQLRTANGGKHPHLSAAELTRVGEELVRLEREGEIALQDGDTSRPRQISFPPPKQTRAAQLLDQYTRAEKMNPYIQLSVKKKTKVIDKILYEARQVLEEQKRARDEALAKAGTKEPEI